MSSARDNRREVNSFSINKLHLFWFVGLFVLALPACTSSQVDTNTGLTSQLTATPSLSTATTTTPLASGDAERDSTETPTPTITSTSTIVSPLPAPTRTPVVSTPTPPATATPHVIVISPDPNDVSCSLKELPEAVPIEVVSPFCIVWRDEFEDEQGFRIHLDYSPSGERFVYEVGPNVTQLIVAEANAPRLTESFEQCRQRNAYVIQVVALRPDTDWRVGSMAANIECGSVEGTLLPTATATP